MDELKSTPVKQRFYDMCVGYGVDYAELTDVADLAGISHEVAKNMFIGNPVARKDAEALLPILSHIVGTSLSLDTVTIPLLNESEVSPNVQSC